jgi:diacylglycerol kinase
MKKFFDAFAFAWSGLVVAFHEQRNLRIHLLVAAGVVAAGFYFGINKMEWITLSIVSGMVIGAELLNSSIEALVDLVSPEHKPMAGKVKDVAAGAVLVTAITSVVVGVLIFSDYLLKFVQ